MSRPLAVTGASQWGHLAIGRCQAGAKLQGGGLVSRDTESTQEDELPGDGAGLRSRGLWVCFGSRAGRIGCKGNVQAQILNPVDRAQLGFQEAG